MFRRPVKLLPISEFYEQHWQRESLTTEFLFSKARPHFFFAVTDRGQYCQVLRQKFPSLSNEIIAGADRVIANRVDMLGSGVTDLGAKINWHLDFKDGYAWELQHYSRIKIVDLDNTADVKIPWELSRFQFVTTLGQAYWFTGDEKYAAKFIALVEDWIKDNPVDEGVNWTCSMEIAIRAVNLIWGLYFFGGSQQMSTEFVRKLVQQLYYHALHIERNLEIIAPGANSNHLTSNYLGLFYCGLLFPEFDRSQRWLRMGREGLEEEMQSQVFDDGADFECSLSYHRLVLEMFLSASLLGCANGVKFSDNYRRRLKMMLHFSTSVTGPSGLVPAIGDNDDGFIVKLVSDNPHDHRPLIDVGLTALGEAVPRSIDPSPERLWYLGRESMNRVNDGAELPSELHSSSGYAVARNNNFHLLFNCVEIPSGCLAGHKHNDLLSFTLEIDKRQLLIDHGTACYTGDYILRNRSRSTAMHNTLTFDNSEQNRFFNRRLFYMCADAKVSRKMFTDTGAIVILSAAHSGYERLPSKMEHQRTIYCHLEERTVLIIDELIGTDSVAHNIVRSFLTPLMTIDRIGASSLFIQAEEDCGLWMSFMLNNASELTVEESEQYPRYGLVRPAMRIVCRHTSSLPARFETLISYGSEPSDGGELYSAASAERPHPAHQIVGVPA